MSSTMPWALPVKSAEGVEPIFFDMAPMAREASIGSIF